MERDPDTSLPTSSMSSFCPKISPAISKKYNIHDEQAQASTKATELRRFLTDQIGRPQYEKVIRIGKSDLVELLVALRAEKAGIGRPVNAVPTSLSLGAEQHIPDTISERNQPTHHPDVNPDQFIELTDGWETRIKSIISNNKYHVYEFDVTPPSDGEGEDIILLRRHAKALERHGETAEDLRGIMRAGYHLNQDESVYYVGYSNKVIERLGEHIRGATNSGSTFPHLFKPSGGVIDITDVEPDEDPKTLEVEKADKLSKTGFSWAYYN